MVQRQSIFYDFSGAYSDASDRLTYKVCSCERKTAEKNYTVTTSLTQDTQDTCDISADFSVSDISTLRCD